MSWRANSKVWTMSWYFYLAKCVSCAPGRDAPATPVVGVAPEKVAHGALVGNLLQAVKGPGWQISSLSLLWIKVKLDQVYCAWLIKWVVKREIIQLAELCLTRWWIISGTWWYWVSIWRYWLVLGQYKLVLLGIRWYMVSKGLVCLYILEKVEIWSGVTDAWHTDNRI